MGKEQTEKVIDAFMDNYKRSSGSLIVLSGGVKSSTINRSPVDAKVLDVDRITANKVARVYNIPPSLLGDYSSSSYASQEQQQMEYLERTIIPICRMYEAQPVSYTHLDVYKRQVPCRPTLRTRPTASA